MNSSVAIIGAGKIGRGFLAHMLFISGKPFCLVDSSPQLVSALGADGSYGIHVVGNPSASCAVSGFSVCGIYETEHFRRVITDADLLFTSVGGARLADLARSLAPALKTRSARRPGALLNIVVCENWLDPADALGREINRIVPGLFGEGSDGLIGITDAVILRTAMNPFDDREGSALDVVVQDYWELPIDGSRLVSAHATALGDMPGVRLLDDFRGLLARKFYTSNAANATLAYLGHLKKYRLLADAAADPEIWELLEEMFQEIDDALARKFDVGVEDQRELSSLVADKLRNRRLGDTIERNARDPLRKLGPDDRLVGAARIIMEAGGAAEGVATGIAAALFYEHGGDRSSEELAKLRKAKGIQYVLRQVCGLTPEAPLERLVLRKVRFLGERGYIATGGGTTERPD